MTPDAKRLAFATWEVGVQAVPHAGKSLGGEIAMAICHLRTYEVPKLTISRRVYFTWAASSDMAGINGSKISHSASVRSDGYAFRSLISSSPFFELFYLCFSFLFIGLRAQC